MQGTEKNWTLFCSSGCDYIARYQAFSTSCMSQLSYIRFLILTFRLDLFMNLGVYWSKDVGFIALMTKKKMPYFASGELSWAYLGDFSLHTKGVKFAWISRWWPQSCNEPTLVINSLPCWLPVMPWLTTKRRIRNGKQVAVCLSFIQTENLKV